MIRGGIIAGNRRRTSYDADAAIYFSACSNDFATSLYTDVEAKTAFNDFFIFLKDYSLFSKYSAFYLCGGGTSGKHLVNAKNPGTFNLTFFGGWTHNEYGITPNGTTGYANTGINENTHLVLNDTHLSIYSRTNSDGLMCDIGITAAASETNIFSKYSNVFYPRVNNTNSGVANTTNSQRLFISNRVGSSEIRGMQDGTLKTIADTSVGKANGNIYIGALNRLSLSDIAFYSNRNLAFASVGSGLTDQNMTDMTTAVNTLQTALHRNV
jgi:hypothetical protein